MLLCVLNRALLLQWSGSHLQTRFEVRQATPFRFPVSNWLSQLFQDVDFLGDGQPWEQLHLNLQSLFSNEFDESRDLKNPDHLREIIIQSNELEGWRVWLEWELLDGGPTLGDLQSEAIELLPEPTAPVWQLLRHLVHTHKAPTVKLLCSARLNHSQICTEAIVAAMPKSKRTLRQILRPLKTLRVDPRNLVSDIQQLKNAGILFGNVSQTLLRELNPALQEALLEKSSRVELLEPEFLDHINQAPHLIKFTPEFFELQRLRELALDQIASRSGEFNVLLERWIGQFPDDVQSNTRLIYEALKRSYIWVENSHKPVSASLEASLFKHAENPVLWQLLLLHRTSKTDVLGLLSVWNPHKDYRILDQVVRELQSWLTELPADRPQSVRHCWKRLSALQNAGLLEKVVNKRWIAELSAQAEKSESERYFYERSSPILIEKMAEQNWFFWRAWALFRRQHPSLPDLPKTTQFLRFKMGFVDQVSLHQAASLSEEKFGRIHAWVHPAIRKRLVRGGTPSHFRLLGRIWKLARKQLAYTKWLELIDLLPEPELKVLMEEIPPKERGLKLWELFVNLPSFWAREEAVDETIEYFPIRRWRAEERDFPAIMKDLSSREPKLLCFMYRIQTREWRDKAEQHVSWGERVFSQLGNLEELIRLEEQTTEKERNQASARARKEFPPNLQAALEVGIMFGVNFIPFLLGVSMELKLLSDQQLNGYEMNGFYRTYDLPKASGGKRKITAPKPTLKAFQRAVLARELEKWHLHDAATGFRTGYSIVDNAKLHVGRKLVVNVDIKGFFPNTKFPLVLKTLRKHLHDRLSPSAIRLLAVLLSYDGALPTGAPTSPALANQVLLPTDSAIQKAAQTNGVTYTRYADDLTFSCDSRAAIDLLPFVEQVLREQGYELDPKKTNFFRKGRRQCVTGLVVNQAVNWARPLRRRLRAAVHQRIQGGKTSWHGRPMNDSELLGRISFLEQTQPKEAKLLRSQLEEVGIS